MNARTAAQFVIASRNSIEDLRQLLKEHEALQERLKAAEEVVDMAIKGIPVKFHCGEYRQRFPK